MIEAELKGKVPGNEDILTSTALGLLRLLPDNFFFGFLSLAQSIVDDDAVIDPGSHLTELEFWPNLEVEAIGVPDAFVQCTPGDHGQHITHIVIEVKRGAPQHGDQLVRYALGLNRYMEINGLPPDHAAILYLTHHGYCPHGELELARQTCIQQGGAVRFFWLSWYRLHSFLIQQVALNDPNSTEVRVCKYLMRYLEGIGYGSFCGFTELPNQDCELHFYRQTILSMPGGPPSFFYKKYYFGYL